jgi:hypothetical protein
MRPPKRFRGETLGSNLVGLRSLLFHQGTEGQIVGLESFQDMDWVWLLWNASVSDADEVSTPERSPWTAEDMPGCFDTLYAQAGIDLSLLS